MNKPNWGFILTWTFILAFTVGFWYVIVKALF